MMDIDDALIYVLILIVTLLIIVPSICMYKINIDKNPLQRCMDDCYTSDNTLQNECKMKCIDLVPELADKLIIVYKEVSANNICGE